MKLKTIHFVGVILGQLYVAAEFTDGTLRHYYLQDPPAWAPNTFYGIGALVQPTTPNGFYYQAPTSNPAPAWAPGTVYAMGDTVQPTVPNGYTYSVVQVTGDSPASGTEEPVWPTSPGAQVFEGIEQSSVPSAVIPPNQGGTPLNSKITDRYGILPLGDA